MPKTKKDEMRALGMSMFKNGFRYISGKWFHHDNEITNINDMIRIANHGVPLFDEEIGKVKEIIRNSDRQENIKGIWPQIKWPEVHGELPFPLDDKQLILINRMLYHPFDNKDRNLIICSGIGGSGKSTYLNIIKQLHKNDCGNASVSDLSNPFMVAEAVSHRLICSDEIGAKDLDCEVLKKIASKQEMTINPKFQTPHDIHTQSNCFWCCNNLPKLDISDSGLLRRVCFYTRNTKIENPDQSLQQHVYTDEELAIIATKAKEYEDDLWFEHNFQEETREWIMKSNSVWRYWADDYQLYCVACDIARQKPFSEPKWIEIHNLFVDWYEECGNKERLSMSTVVKKSTR